MIEYGRMITMGQKSSAFHPDSFRNPPNEYRPLQIVHGLDHSLSKPESLDGLEGIDDRLKKLREMGIGGIVANVGFRDYLVDPKQWDILRYGLRKADELGMVLWLYDEKGYPSGTAGGYVTRSHPEYAALGLATYAIPADPDSETEFYLPESCKAFYAAFAVSSMNDATAASMRDVSGSVDDGGALRWKAPGTGWTIVYLAERVMYEGTHSSGNVCELKHYVNLLEPGATKEFIRVTHERYAREIPAEIWKKIRAVFTDEPSFMTKYTGDLPERFAGKISVVDMPLFKDRPPAVPWSGQLASEFKRLKGYDLRPYSYALFFSESEEACAVRQDYYDVIARIYADAFYTQILDWCVAHGIASSGHVMAEEDIASHVAFHGSLFAVIRKMDLPGIDMLNSDPRSMLENSGFMTAKQVASVAHLTGAKEVHSESSDWCQRNEGKGAALPQRRGQGNLQYVLGINEVTAYWGWSDIGEDGYRAYNDYMGRLGLLLRGGVHVCEVAVLYPIRSAWAHFTPTTRLDEYRVDKGESRKMLEELSADYTGLVRTLLRSQIDLDIIDEEALLTCEIRGGALRVADEAFRVIVLPPMDTMSLGVAKRLAEFVKSGGFAVFTGELPRRAESVKNSDAMRAELKAVERGKDGVRLSSIETAPEVVKSLIHPDFRLKSLDPDILYTHRWKDGRDLYFIINNGDMPAKLEPTLSVSGPYEIYRPLTGEIEKTEQLQVLDIDGYEGIFVVGG